MRSTPRRTSHTARVLQKNGCEVWIPRIQGCCGALHYHAAEEEPAPRVRRGQLRRRSGPTDAEKFKDVDAIITNAAGCGAQLKDYAHMLHGTPHAEAAARFQSKVRDVSEFLMELGPVKPTHPLPMKATYHDACHLRHAQQIFKQPRQLLEMIPGLELVPLPESELCCGAAGSYNLTQPEMAERLGDRKAANIIGDRRRGRVHRQRRLPHADHPAPQGDRPGHLVCPPGRCAVGELQRRDAGGIQGNGVRGRNAPGRLLSSPRRGGIT